MNDKTKPAKPDVTPTAVATTLAACGSSSDASSTRISSAIIAENYNSGKRGAEAIGGARLSENVGQCVADAYDDKKPSAADKARGWLTGVMNAASDAASSVTAAVNDLAIKPGQGATTVDRHNRTAPPEQRL